MLMKLNIKNPPRFYLFCAVIKNIYKHLKFILYDAYHIINTKIIYYNSNVYKYTIIYYIFLVTMNG